MWLQGHYILNMMDPIIEHGTLIPVTIKLQREPGLLSYDK